MLSEVHQTHKLIPRMISLYEKLNRKEEREKIEKKNYTYVSVFSLRFHSNIVCELTSQDLHFFGMLRSLMLLLGA